MEKSMNKQAEENLKKPILAEEKKKQDMWWSEGCEELMIPAKSVSKSFSQSCTVWPLGVFFSRLAVTLHWPMIVSHVRPLRQQQVQTWLSASLQLLSINVILDQQCRTFSSAFLPLSRCCSASLLPLCIIVKGRNFWLQTALPPAQLYIYLAEATDQYASSFLEQHQASWTQAHQEKVLADTCGS